MRMEFYALINIQPLFLVEWYSFQISLKTFIKAINYQIVDSSFQHSYDPKFFLYSFFFQLTRLSNSFICRMESVGQAQRHAKSIHTQREIGKWKKREITEGQVCNIVHPKHTQKSN